jgi:hypothetical protein
VPSYQAATSTNVSGFVLPDAPAVPLLSIDGIHLVNTYPISFISFF